MEQLGPSLPKSLFASDGRPTSPREVDRSSVLLTPAPLLDPHPPPPAPEPSVARPASGPPPKPHALLRRLTVDLGTGGSKRSEDTAVTGSWCSAYDALRNVACDEDRDDPRNQPDQEDLVNDSQAEGGRDPGGDGTSSPGEAMPARPTPFRPRHLTSSCPEAVPARRRDSPDSWRAFAPHVSAVDGFPSISRSEDPPPRGGTKDLPGPGPSPPSGSRGICCDQAGRRWRPWNRSSGWHAAS
jgi:hypothetical protein